MAQKIKYYALFNKFLYKPIQISEKEKIALQTLVNETNKRFDNLYLLDSSNRFLVKDIKK